MPIASEAAGRSGHGNQPRAIAMIANTASPAWSGTRSSRLRAGANALVDRAERNSCT